MVAMAMFTRKSGSSFIASQQELCAGLKRAKKPRAKKPSGTIIFCLQKLRSDDTAMEYLSNSDSVYFAEVERLSNWCKVNSLD